MIQQIYITDYLSDAAAQSAAVIEALTAQCPLLLQADWQVMPVAPLTALFQVLQGTEPAAISPVSAVLRARQAWVAPPALCLLPVHLNLQRDTFSLQGTVPLPAHIYAWLTDRLQQHFAQDFIVHAAPEQRFWWIQPLHPVDVQCRWPQDCLYQQAMQWQPQGKDAALIRQWSNEIQMLLHQLASAAEVPDWPLTLNSLWFASVPELPLWQHERQVAGTGAVFDGLRACQLPGLVTRPLADVVADKTVRHALMVADQLQDVDWAALATAMQHGRLPALEIVLPFVERSVRVRYRRRARWQFWRKAQSLPVLLQQLESSLPSARLPAAT
ncbi:hypothetical protein SAMN05192566_0496 [Methylophilus rhizosphaerae]|uniref:Uncharacterized protein n=1 Tax=Methylophilus rhizosphaerae TaxID=492660 RepID=A0A1G8ZSD7_9PROT|nr:hypothetical protein [Methylophilus rhizosphaerae]SDK18026.1 hypothetical protein SAMN05192566_0496 [Methylophilus rhizosphaerae]